MQKLKPLSGSDEYCVHRLLEEERQKEALAAYNKRDREQQKGVTGKTALLIFATFFFGPIALFYLIGWFWKP